jgi:hypothetical protein
MMDHNLNDALRAARPARAPRDIVPEPGQTREAALHLRDLTGQEVTITEPGQPIFDSEGSWIGMGEPTTTTAVLAGLILTDEQATRFGLPQTNDGDSND